MIDEKGRLRISLGPDELNELDLKDFVHTIGATVEIGRNTRPEAQVCTQTQTKLGKAGLLFMVSLPSMKIPFPDPGHESEIAVIPRKRIEINNDEAEEVYERLLGERITGLALVGHGQFNDPEALRKDAR